MLGLILGAVRARTAQAAGLLVLAVLAAVVAAAAPWYGSAAAARAAAADIATAPAGLRTLSVRQMVTLDGDPAGARDTFAGAVRGLLRVGDGRPVFGMTQAMTVPRAATSESMAVAYRDDFCAHVRLDGDCPAAPGETALAREAAQQLGVEPGERVVVRASPSTEPITLRMTARYDLADPTGAYWSNALFRADDGYPPAFTPLETFRAAQLDEPTLAYDETVPDRLIRGDGGFDLGAELRAADRRLAVQQFQLVNPTAVLLDTIRRDRATIRSGVLVATVQVVVLAWFAIGLAGRYTGRDRRGDAALLKLRGSTRLGMLRLTVGQHLVPLLAGVLIGAPAGVALARLLGGPVAAADRAAVLSTAAVAVAVVLAGALLVLALVEFAVLRRPVSELLRRVPSGRRDWRAGAVDLALLAVAVAGVYQARAGGPDSGLGLAAPLLVALIVALLVARLLSRAADRLGGAALRAGRLRLGLAAVQASRQPGTDRVFALVVVAVAGFATAAGGFAGVRQAGAERSDAELGAARVLTVQAESRTALRAAVRRADPGGRRAMAVVVDRAADPPVLAVDTDRLAAVARWRPEYGAVRTLPDALAAVRPPAAPPLITGDDLTLRVRGGAGGPLTLTALLQNESTGAAVPVTFGPIRSGERTVTAAVRGCAGPPGCRLARWELAGPAEDGGRPGPPPKGATVTVRSLAQSDPPAEILDAAALGDITRWRSDTTGTALDLTAADGALTLTTEADETTSAVAGNRVSVVDAPLPLPVVLAGPQPKLWQSGDPGVLAFGSGVTPVRVAGAVPALPVLGAAGMLTDLEAARRAGAGADAGGSYQVWLTADAPASLVGALTAAGLTVTADDTAAGRAGRLAAQGPAAAARFALLAGAVTLLLAAAAVAVAAAVDRSGQIAQLSALRVQGLPGAAAVGSGYAGLTALLAAGLLTGPAAALVARPVAGVVVPPFTDAWRVIAPPGPLGAAALAVAGLVALAVLGVTGWLSALPLIRRLRGGAR